jgi:hypothetical protein
MNPVTQARKHDPDGRWLRRWVPESGGDAAPRDPIADPGASRRDYLAAADDVPPADAQDPPRRRPRLDLATDAALAAISGIGPRTAADILDARCEIRQRKIEGVPGVGPKTAASIAARFTTD